MPMKRPEQIELMDKIYRRAYIVTAALVVDDEALNFKEELRNLLGDWAVEFWSRLSTSTTLVEYQKAMIKHLMTSWAADVLNDLRLSYFKNQSSQSAWYQQFAPQRRTCRIKAFQQLMANSWFERMWVVQEVALPQSLRIMYGDLEIEWKDLVNAMGLITRNSTLRGPLLESGDSVGFRVPPPAAVGTIPMMDLLRQWVQDDKDRPLAELLLRCRPFIAAEPKDKIFAIRGMCSRLPEALLKPTESTKITYEKVLINAAECLVAEGDTAKMLSASGGVTEGETQLITTLPSWVPDWSIKQAGTPMSFADEKKDYRAGGLRKIKARIESRSLYLDGILFDNIVGLGPVWNATPFLEGSWKATDHLFKLPPILKASYELVIWSTWTKEPYSGVESQRLREAFWRTLIGNRTLNGDPAPSSLEKAFETFEEFQAKILKTPDWVKNDRTIGLKEQMQYLTMSEYSHPAMQFCGARRICVTMKGYIGMVPPRSKIGDNIVVFVGMQTPFVVRKVRSDSGTSIKHQNVGECYVHGLMNAEIYKTGIPRSEFQLI